MAAHPPATANGPGDGRLTAAQVFAALNEIRPAHAVLMEEMPVERCSRSKRHGRSPSPARSTPSPAACLGWGLPASVGIALAERDTGRNRPVIVIIGDGSLPVCDSVDLGCARNFTSRC